MTNEEELREEIDSVIASIMGCDDEDAVEYWEIEIMSRVKKYFLPRDEAYKEGYYKAVPFKEYE